MSDKTIEARELLMHAQYANEGVTGFVARLLEQIEALQRQAAALRDQRDTLERMLKTTTTTFGPTWPCGCDPAHGTKCADHLT